MSYNDDQGRRRSVRGSDTEIREELEALENNQNANDNNLMIPNHNHTNQNNNDNDNNNDHSSFDENSNITEVFPGHPNDPPDNIRETGDYVSTDMPLNSRRPDDSTLSGSSVFQSPNHEYAIQQLQQQIATLNDRLNDDQRSNSNRLNNIETNITTSNQAFTTTLQQIVNSLQNNTNSREPNDNPSSDPSSNPSSSSSYARSARSTASSRNSTFVLSQRHPTHQRR